MLGILLSLGARWHWTLELATHFVLQYAIALLIPFTLAIWLRRKWAAMTCLIALVYLGWQLAPLYWPIGNSGKHGDPVRFLIANVHTGNQDYQELIDLVEVEHPDVIVLMEVDRSWLEALTPLEVEYSQMVLRPRSDNFGMAVYSKINLEDVQTIILADSEVPTITGRIAVGDGSLAMIATHPLPPISAEYARTRNGHLQELADLVRDTAGPIIVMGDLNTTSWSPQFADLQEKTDLYDSRQGFGVQGTWPLPYSLLSIPLDHALVSRELTVLDRRVGSAIGSDHLPIIVDVAIRSKSQ